MRFRASEVVRLKGNVTNGRNRVFKEHTDISFKIGFVH